jgi:GTP-binding protein EngB required for normal cell division
MAKQDHVAEVTARASELTAALEVGAPWLDPEVVDQAITSVERSVQRLQVGAGHTVVALVGATGSGKSSLFNALARMEIAPVGARRPLTSEPMACVWGEGGSAQLLNWLQVPEHRRVTRESVLDADYQAPLHGLVLLDLPDHDSTEAIHRFEVDRLVTMVDLMVWVVDPQKYADDALHSGYLQQLGGHDGVMVVVLNQIDRLTAEEATTCENDLRRLLDGDGLAKVPLLPISATEGTGVEELRSILAEVVQDRYAIADRIDADLRATTKVVLGGLAPIEPGHGEPPGVQVLVEELAGAAGVPTVVDSLAASHRRRGWQRAGWPALLLLNRLGRERRRRLGRTVDEPDLELLTASLEPVSAPAQRARVGLAVEATLNASADTLPRRWAAAVRDAVQPGDRLVAALDEEIAAVDLRLDPPLWWWAVAVLQYLLTAAAVVGTVWLIVIGWLRIGALWIDFDPDHLIGRPAAHPAQPLGLLLPAWLLILGLGLGGLVAALTVWGLRAGARKLRQSAAERLHAAIESAVYELVIVPIRVVLAQHRATRLALVGDGLTNTGSMPRHSAPSAPPATPVSVAPGQIYPLPVSAPTPPRGVAPGSDPGAAPGSAAQRLWV